MGSAPTLNKPPRSDPDYAQDIAQGNFAKPPRPQQPPDPDRAQDLRQAAIAHSMGSGGAAIGAPPPKPPKAPLIPGVPGINQPSPPANHATNHPQGSHGAGGLNAPGTHPPGYTPGQPGTPPPGAPDPGTPPTAPFNIPLLPTDEAAKAGAEQDYTTAAAAARYGGQQAAFNYGDPAMMAQWGVAGVNPNSALALAALREQQQSQNNVNLMGRNNTLFSSINQDNANKIGAGQQRADLLGNQRYQQAMARFNQIMTGAINTRTKTIDLANADERQTAINNLPGPGQAAGDFGTGSTNSLSKVGKPNKPSGGGKTPTLKNPSSPKGPKAGKGSKSTPGTKGSGRVPSGKAGGHVTPPKGGGSRVRGGSRSGGAGASGVPPSVTKGANTKPKLGKK